MDGRAPAQGRDHEQPVVVGRRPTLELNSDHAGYFLEAKVTPFIKNDKEADPNDFLHAPLKRLEPVYVSTSQPVGPWQPKLYPTALERPTSYLPQKEYHELNALLLCAASQCGSVPLLDRLSSIQYQPQELLSALRTACASNQLDALQFLVQAAATGGLVAPLYGQTYGEMLADMCSSSVTSAIGSPYCLHLLLARGAEVSRSDERNNTPLHIAACLGDFSSCKILLHHGGDVNARNYQSYTPLQEASRRGFIDVVRVMIGTKRVSGWNRRMAATFAAAHPEVVLTLLQGGANDAPDTAPPPGGSPQARIRAGPDAVGRDNPPAPAHPPYPTPSPDRQLMGAEVGPPIMPTREFQSSPAGPYYPQGFQHSPAPSRGMPSPIHPAMSSYHTRESTRSTNWPPTVEPLDPSALPLVYPSLPNPTNNYAAPPTVPSSPPRYPNRSPMHNRDGPGGQPNFPSPSSRVGLRVPKNERRSRVRLLHPLHGHSCRSVYQYYCREYDVKPKPSVESSMPDAPNSFSMERLHVSERVVLGNLGLLPLLEVVRLNPGLQTLCLPGNSITSEGVEWIVEMAVEHPSLTHLDLSENQQISTAGGAALMYLLQQNPRVSVLKLEGTSIGTSVLQAIVDTIVDRHSRLLDPPSE